MANRYLRNLHAQFYGMVGAKKLVVYFETNMDSSWDLNLIQSPPGNLINADTTLKFIKK